MALAETASIFCETLVVEEGLERLEGRDRLALLDTDLQGTNQVIVDIRSRFIFETEVFARRQRKRLLVGGMSHHALTRPRYSPDSVETFTFSPVVMNSGTWICLPVSKVAGLVPPVERSPCRPGSV